MEYGKELRKYISKVYSFTYLSKEEENKLIKKIKENGDEKAKIRLINSNLKSVIKIAKRYYFGILDLWDLIEAGNIGLIQAIPKFEPEKEKTFSNYASYRIKAAILYLLKKEKFPIIGYKDKKIDLFRRFKKVEKIILRNNQGSLSLEKAAEMIGKPIKELEKLLYDVYQIGCISENTPINNSPESIKIKDSLSFSNKNIINPEEDIQKKDIWKKTREILSYLTPREEKVLRMIYGVGEKKEHTLKEIKKLFGISRMRVYQIKNKALKKLEKKFVTGTKKFQLNDYL